MKKGEIQKLIQDLIFFYVKENYNKYLTDKKLKKIPEKNINKAVIDIYHKKKDHLKVFLKESLKTILTDDYMGDLIVDNICNDIFQDDKLCTNRLIKEIKNFQKNK